MMWTTNLQPISTIRHLYSHVSSESSASVTSMLLGGVCFVGVVLKGYCVECERKHDYVF